jgi:hypothetical protein
VAKFWNPTGAKITYSLMSIDEFQRQIADKY